VCVSMCVSLRVSVYVWVCMYGVAAEGGGCRLHAVALVKKEHAAAKIVQLAQHEGVVPVKMGVRLAQQLQGAVAILCRRLGRSRLLHARTNTQTERPTSK
jgi:hypothetical protein